MENKRTLVFRLYQVLYDYSDEKHPLTQEKIIKHLIDDYDMEVERKAVSRNISYLKEMGYEIEQTKNGAYLASREFESSELRLLIDSVLCSGHITAKYSKDLIAKLRKLGGKNFDSRIKHVFATNDWNKTENREVFYNIDVFDAAIDSGCQVRFDYNKIGVDKKLHLTASHTFSPYQMLLHNQHYYIMGYEEKWKNVTFLRMDKITNIQKLDDVKSTPMREIPELRGGINYKELSTARPYMFSDKPERVVLWADQWLMDDIIDWFGNDVKVKQVNDKTIEVILRASPLAMRYWALQYGASVEVKEPQHLRDDIKKCICAMQEKYKD